MARRGSSARAAALRRAQEAKAARDAARLRREKDIEAALADYFEAIGHAERIRTEARRKADRLHADAELAAMAPRHAAIAAVRRLRDLVGTVTEVATLCGISAGEVRAAFGKPVPRSHLRAGTDEPAHTEPESDGVPAHRATGPGSVQATPPHDAPDHGLQQPAGPASDLAQAQRPAGSAGDDERE